MKKSIPKYILIYKDIVSKIESGELKPGDSVPSENELISTYNISNTTARRSLQEIEMKGWATRMKGKGTFVLNRTADQHLTRVLGSFDAMKESFSHNLLKEGFTPRNIILEKIVLENGISTHINGRHYIIEGQTLKIHRLRYGNNTLLKDETKYISMALCPKINMIELEESLIKVYENQYSLQLDAVERTLGVATLHPNDPVNFFESDIPLAVFILDGAVFDVSGNVVEIEKSYYRGDKYKFSIKTKPNLMPGTSKMD